MLLSFAETPHAPSQQPSKLLVTSYHERKAAVYSIGNIKYFVTQHIIPQTPVLIITQYHMGLRSQTWTAFTNYYDSQILIQKEQKHPLTHSPPPPHS